MSDQRLGTSEFSDLFREEAAGMLGLLPEPSLPERPLPSQPPAVRAEPPRLPSTAPAPEDAVRNYWRTLRTFFRTGKGGGLPRDGRNPTVFPALLAPFKDRPMLLQPYPCWMPDTETIRKGESPDASALPISNLLRQTVEAFAPGEKDAIILKDNLRRLELRIQEKLRLVDAAFQSFPLLEEALRELVTELAVSGPEGETFAQDIDRLKKHLPKTGVLIPFATHAPLHILATHLQVRRAARRETIREAVAPLVSRLHDLLAVEREKSPTAKSPEQLHSALDFADEFLRFDELSALLPSGGAERMPEERYLRIENILQVLETAESLLGETNAHLALALELKEEDPTREWDRLLPGSTLSTATAAESCATAAAVFDRTAAEAARVFGAIRMGKLELDNQYVPEIHSDFFTHFDWRSFSDWEWSAFPPVLLLHSAPALIQTELNAFSGLLASNRPVNILALHGDSGLPLTETDSRQEPGALAIAHRNTFVLQAAATDPVALLHGWAEGLSSFTPAMFHLSLGDRDYLRAGASVESRAFPGFTYNSRRGPRWGSRFDIGKNPQPETDWPLHPLTIRDEEGKAAVLTIPFTFADFAAQDLRFADLFQLVPPQFWKEDLISLADYLRLSSPELYAKVPFIWMADAAGELQKAAVAWPLVLACRERLDFWHFLQENAGIHSYHVEQATDKLRQALALETKKEITALEERHKLEVEKVKEETARAAMEQLAAMLLDMDTTAGVASSAGPRPSKSPSLEISESPNLRVSPPPEPEAEVEAEEILPPGEAWIETPLCTSCNECKDINSRIFQYNSEKQAFVADPRGGPFADIVLAAEKCPARIIHPGAPQNPGEPGLEEWVKRAAAFN